jgi:hypothetical protein
VICKEGAAPMSLLKLHDVSNASGESAMAVHALDDIDLSGQPADVTATAAGTLRIGPSQHQPVYLNRRGPGRPIQPGVQLPRGEARGAPAVQSGATCSGIDQSESASSGDSPMVGLAPHRPEMNQ